MMRPLKLSQSLYLSLALLLTSHVLSTATAKAILGIDLGNLFLKVALVQRGAPLEIVTNMHSKRKTEQMILFDSGSRFYGADASSLLARKPMKTPVQMTLLLGRDETHPAVQVLKERHFPVTPFYNETRHGLSIAIDGLEDTYTPEELVAMVLSHTQDMTQAYMGELGKDAQSAPRDCVLTIPSFYTVHERRALLDAAALAELNVLGLIEENTAAALHYAMDKQFPEDKVILFYNMGGTAVQVSIVKFYNYNITTAGSTKPKTVGALEVISKAWDSTVGGQSFDHVITDYLAEQFNEQWNKQRNDNQKKDIRTIPRAMTKLRLQANKIKHVLSANQEIPVFVDSLYDDCSLNTKLTRKQLEEMSAALIERATKPIYQALKYSNFTIDDINEVEMIGGGMRIPRIQADLKASLNGMELGMHINADESMALGAAFHGANLSTAFRVRHVGLQDVNPFPITITLSELGTIAAAAGEGGTFSGRKTNDAKHEDDDDDAPWGKHATILKAFGKVGVRKTIAFTHDKDIHCSLDYEESDLLPSGTARPIVRYNISGIEDFAKEMEEKNLGKPKISLQFQLSESGLTNLIKAEAAVEENYMVEEEVEIDEDEDNMDNKEIDKATDVDDSSDESEESFKESELKESDENATEPESNSTTTNATSMEEAAKRPKKKTILQQKEKVRVHKKALLIKTYMVGKVQPYSPELMDESKAKLTLLAHRDRERILLEEAKNKVESFVYFVKNTLVDDEDNVNKVSTEEQRKEVRKLLEKAEEWMYEDGANADLATTEDKYHEILASAEKIFERVRELTARPEAVAALEGRLAKVEELMTKWETAMPQVTEDERNDVLKIVEEVKAWIKEKQEAQEKVAPHEDPVFTSAEVPSQIKPIETLVAKLKKKPKLKPLKTNDTELNTTSNNTTDESNNDAANPDLPVEEEMESKSSEASEEEPENEKVEDEL